jgi:hypothetical protein
MACFGAGALLSCDGNSLDHPYETIDKMDRDRLFQGGFHAS